MNKKLLGTLAIVIAGAASMTTANAEYMMRAPASTLSVMQNDNRLTPAYPIESVACVVSGTPVEFPNDVIFTNDGNVTLSAGTWIQWHLHSQANGWYQLSNSLTPGDHVFVPNVLPGGWIAGVPCDADPV